MNHPVKIKICAKFTVESGEYGTKETMLANLGRVIDEFMTQGYGGILGDIEIERKKYEPSGTLMIESITAIVFSETTKWIYRA